MSMDSCAIGLVVDRSGSMCSVKSDTIGSVERFIAEQKKEAGKGFLKMVQFDHKLDKSVEVLSDLVSRGRSGGAVIFDQEERQAMSQDRGTQALAASAPVTFDGGLLRSSSSLPFPIEP